MNLSNSATVDSAKAREIWLDYQRQHDVTDRVGQAVGVDPITGRVWFGESAKDIWRQMDAQGIRTPIYCVRVGSDYYGRKGKRPCSRGLSI